jgi:Cysteine-rich CPXCG
MSLQSAFIQCPYCGEQIEIVVDCSIERQKYIEDCSVCCRPIVVLVEASDAELTGVVVRREDD